MKEAVFTIRSKGLDTFEGHYKGSTGWFNIDSFFFKSTIDPELYKKYF